MARGLILFAHGSRDPAWGESLHALAREIEAVAPGLRVRCAFLERLAPDLPTVLAERVCGQRGQFVRVQRDLPVLLEEARRVHPGVELRLLPVLSELPGMLAFLARTVVTLAEASVPVAASVAS